MKYLSSLEHELTSQPEAGCTSEGLLDMHSVVEVPSAGQKDLQPNLDEPFMSASALLPEATRSIPG